MSRIDMNGVLGLFYRLSINLANKNRQGRNLTLISDREILMNFRQADDSLIATDSSITFENANMEAVQILNFVKLEVTPTDILYEFDKLEVSNNTDNEVLEFSDLTNFLEVFTKEVNTDYTFNFTTKLKVVTP